MGARCCRVTPALIFIYGVRSTGVYCRPGCPSRRPRRDSVSFFSTPEVAEIAGYRECRRCRPRQGENAPARPHAGPPDACAFIAGHADRPITAGAAGGPRRHQPVSFPTDVLEARRLLAARLPGRAARPPLPGRVCETARRCRLAVYDAGYGSVSRVYERQPDGTGDDAGRPPARAAAARRSATPWWTPRSDGCLIAGTSKGICSVMLGDREIASRRICARNTRTPR